MADTIQVRNKETGKVLTLRSKSDKTTDETREDTSVLPEMTQAVGSVIGTQLGGIPGSTVGAGAGRFVGETAEDIGVRFSPSSGFVTPQKIDRQVANINGLFSGLTGASAEYISSNREAAINNIKKASLASGTDLAFGVGGAAIGKVASFVNKGVARGLFGKEVADRFLTRQPQVLSKLKGGFQDTASKAKNFFKDMTKRIGGEVEKAVLSNPKNLRSMDDVIEGVAGLTENGASVQFLDIPKGQKARISEILNGIAANKGKQVNAESVWNIRKGIDSAIKKMSPTSEGRRLLYGVRNEVANKLKTFNTDITKSFDDYMFVQEADSTLGRYLKGIKNPRGEVVSPKLEQFTKNLLKSDKTETMKLLEDISSMAPKEQQIAEEILDIAAAEGIAKDIGGGVVSRVVLQELGGSQNIAKFLALPSSEQGKAFGRIAQAMGATGFTGLATRED